MNAYELLEQTDLPNPMDEKYFNQLKINFQISYLETRNYFERIDLHRNPAEVIIEVQHELYSYLQKIQNRIEMRDIDRDKGVHGYVHTKIIEIWKADKRLKTCYNSIQQYCKLRKMDFNFIAVHIAEYGGLNKLVVRLERDKNKLFLKHQKKSDMPKHFEIEKRETFEKPYLKVFLKGDTDYENASMLLGNLHSVKRANVTDHPGGKKDLTVYPQRAYDITEVQQEIELALINYFKGSPLDPSFVSETISTISDIAYFQILDHIMIFGKNLEGFKELNTKFDEERYRDYFIPYLNAISNQHSAKGEVFNRKGKTDILIFDKDGNNIFIAECKLWKGEAYLIDAINQLLGNYVNWRDEKTSIIMFNRDVKKFTEVVETATQAVSKHYLCIEFIGLRKDTSYSYLFKHPDDDSKTIKLELLLFNFY